MTACREPTAMVGIPIKIKIVVVADIRPCIMLHGYVFRWAFG